MTTSSKLISRPFCRQSSGLCIDLKISQVQGVDNTDTNTDIDTKDPIFSQV